MNRFAWTALLLFCAGLSACKPRPTVPAEEPAVSEAAAPAPVAVLAFEENLDFAATESFAGGRELYRDEVEGLTKRLRERGLDARTLLVPLDGFSLSDLAPYGTLVIVDAFVIMPPVRAVLEDFVRRGGTLVGVCEVGRFPGDWAKPWPFGELFGLRTRVTDSYGTGVAGGPAGFYRIADVRAPDAPLLRGLTNRIDWGELAQHVWATESAGAEVLATFPQYLSSVDDQAGVVVSNALPAVTLQRHGDGRAVFIAVLPTGRIFDGWRASDDALTLLANAAALGGGRRPAADAPATPVRVTVGVNQYGYEPDWPKRIVVRLQGGDTNDLPAGMYRVVAADGREVQRGPLPAWPGTLWRSRFLPVDLTTLREPGDYRVEISVQGLEAVTVPLRVAEDVVGPLLASQQEFWAGMRCGETCHTTDPVPGGYHDASGDWGLRMWSMPHVLWALARFVEEHPENEALRYELDRTARWMWKMAAPDGAPYAAIKSPTDMSPLEIRPAQDTTQRELETRFSFEYAATYAVAVARCLKPVREQISQNLAQELQVCAERAYRRIREEPADSTKDLGNRLWAAVELYRATRIDDYLQDAQRDARALLVRQLEPGHVVDGDVYGDFYADAARTTFSPQQWKRFHAMGLYMGLVELARLLPDGVLRTDINVVLNRLTDGFLLGMSARSPYGQMAAGLEPAGARRPRADGRGFEPPEKFKVYHFSHRESWVREHGLNCDLMAMATLALERARDTGRPELREMAVRQVNWILGANPLGYGMLEGFATQPSPGIDPAIGTGIIRGALPNGISGRGLDNVPAWGATWDSREYWLPQNAYLLTTLSLLKP
jgi:hypothetical protein